MSMSDNDIRPAAPASVEPIPRPTLPNLLYLTQADESLIAIDAAMISVMQPVERDPHRYDEPPLTRVYISPGPGRDITYLVRETVEEIGGMLASIRAGATFEPIPWHLRTKAEDDA